MTTGQKRDRHLLEGLHSMALHKVAITLAHTPVDLPVQDAGLAHSEVVLLAIESVEEVILPCCDVPLPL